jgi:hypothetical protein
MCPYRISWPKVCGGNFGHLMRDLEMPDEFRPTWKGFCPTPGAKFTEFRPTAAHELAASKRLAAGARGEIGRISPHDKKKKNLVGRKPCPQPAGRRRGRCLACVIFASDAQKQWGDFEQQMVARVKSPGLRTPCQLPGPTPAASPSGYPAGGRRPRPGRLFPSARSCST